MKSEIQIKNSAGVCRIEIEGTIGVPEEWQFDQPEARVATYEKFRDTGSTPRRSWSTSARRAATSTTHS